MSRGSGRCSVSSPLSMTVDWSLGGPLSMLVVIETSIFSDTPGDVCKKIVLNVKENVTITWNSNLSKTMQNNSDSSSVLPLLDYINLIQGIYTLLVISYFFHSDKNIAR